MCPSYESETRKENEVDHFRDIEGEDSLDALQPTGIDPDISNRNRLKTEQHMFDSLEQKNYKAYL
jgi:hypothetical protein